MAALAEGTYMSSRDGSWRVASGCCALVTLVGVPLSFFGVLHVTWDPKTDNPASAAAYFFMCLVVALPLTVVNSLLIAPCVAKMARARLSAVASHLVLVAAWAALVPAGRLFFWWLGVLQFPTAWGWLLSWPLLFWNLTIFLGPAVVIGSFVYSLQYNSMWRKRIPCA